MVYLGGQQQSPVKGSTLVANAPHLLPLCVRHPTEDRGTIPMAEPRHQAGTSPGCKHRHCNSVLSTDTDMASRREQKAAFSCGHVDQSRTA